MTAKEEKAAPSKVVVVGKPVAKGSKRDEEVELSRRPMQETALAFIGGIMVIMGALLAWATGAPEGAASMGTRTGLEVGAPGILALFFGLIAMGLVFLARRSSLLGAIIFGSAIVALVVYGMVYMSSLTKFATPALEPGVYVTLAGSIVLIIGSIVTFRKTEPFALSVRALITFIFGLTGTFLLLLYPFIFPGSGAIGGLFFIFGLLLLIPTFYLIEAEGWSWSSAVIVLVLVLLMAVPTLSYVAIGYSITFAVVLYLFRLTFGVGAWKIQKEKEEKETKIRNKKRTANAEGLHCPNCKSTKLYITDDGSTFCAVCKRGFVNIRDAKAGPKSSVQI